MFTWSKAKESEELPDVYLATHLDSNGRHCQDVMSLRGTDNLYLF